MSDGTFFVLGYYYGKYGRSRSFTICKLKKGLEYVFRIESCMCPQEIFNFFRACSPLKCMQSLVQGLFVEEEMMMINYKRNIIPGLAALKSHKKFERFSAEAFDLTPPNPCAHF